MGADCIVNNLHFHVLCTDDLYGNPEKVFPIETADKRQFFTTSLKHKDADEINMYNCGVRFGEVFNFPMRALLISPMIDSEDTSLEDAQEALAHCCGVVLNQLIDSNIPHNLLVADEGMTVYIIPRKFDMMIYGVNFFTSFESVCGMIKFKNQASYDQATEDQTYKQLDTLVSLSEEEFNAFKSDLMEKFRGEYECEGSIDTRLNNLKI